MLLVSFLDRAWAILNGISTVDSGGYPVKLSQPPKVYPSSSVCNVILPPNSRLNGLDSLYTVIKLGPDHRQP